MEFSYEEILIALSMQHTFGSRNAESPPCEHYVVSRIYLQIVDVDDLDHARLFADEVQSAIS